jgi:peptide/nickel transport system substrate-binding protein
VRAYIEGFALRPVTAYNASGKNTCLLCTEMPTLDNGMVTIDERPPGLPGMSVTIKLREGLQWGDGAPLTARDIAFTAKVGHDPIAGFSNTHAWGRVESVEVVNDQTAILHLDEVSSEFDNIGTLLPEHLEGPIYRAAGATEYLKQSLYNRAPTTPGLWNGPFLPTHIDTGNSVTLEPNPHWTGSKPHLKRIVLRTAESTSALLATLLAGEVDMTAGEGLGLTLDQALTLARTQPTRYNYVFKTSLGFDHIDLQLDNPILSDVRVRRALLTAIDRRTIATKLYDAKFTVADSSVGTLSPFHIDDIAKYPFDPAKARRMLAEAGWTPGPDGICQNAVGTRLVVEFSVAAGAKLRELTEQVIQAEWKTVGVEMVIHNEVPRILFGESLKHRTFQGAVLYSWLFSATGSPRQLMGSDQIPSAENNWSGANYPGWHNEAVDGAIKMIETELDVEKRAAAWATIQRAYAEELPSLPMFQRVEVHALPKWLHNLEPTGHTDYAVLWAENWRAD